MQIGFYMDNSDNSKEFLRFSPEALLEGSDQLLNSAIEDNRRRRAIKNMAFPIMWGQDELIEKRILFSGMRQRELLNQFREIRIKLLQKTQRDNFVLLVSSVSSLTDSSQFAFNLAAVFALDQHKTALYVDCNTYRNNGERYCATPVDQGLIHYLVDYSVELQNIIYPSGIERIRVIPAGGSSESAAEFFNSKRMEVLVAEIKSRYPDRFIVLDAPCVQQSTEARILSQFCDLVLLVVPYGEVVADEVFAAMDAVGKSRFAGAVFNH